MGTSKQSWLVSTLTHVEEVWAELKGSWGYRIVSAVAFVWPIPAALVRHFFPSVVGYVASWISLSIFSFPTWVIFILIVLLIAAIDGGRRVVSKYRKPEAPLRPRLEGACFDVYVESYSTPSASALEAANRTGQPCVFSPDDVVGSHVYVGVRFISEEPVETTIRNFRLELETDEGQFEARYPERGEILQLKDGQLRTDARRFYNLDDHVRKMRTIAHGKQVVGHLHFMLQGLVPLIGLNVFGLRVVAIDQWGGEHVFPLDMTKNSAVRPEERIRVLLGQKW